MTCVATCILCVSTGLCRADDVEDQDDIAGLQADDAVVDDDLGKSREGSRTDDEVIERCARIILYYS